MAKNQHRNRLLSRPIRWQFVAAVALLVYPFARAINSHLNANSDTLFFQIDLYLLPRLIVTFVSEFGALVVLFGLCVFTLYIGLRMLLHPVVGWEEN